MGKIHSQVELAIGDEVLTPRGRRARVLSHKGDRVILQYMTGLGFEFPGDEVTLRASLLELVSKAPPPELPKGFFAGERRG